MTNHIKNALPIVARAIGEKLDVNVVFDDGPARMDFDNIYLPNGDMDDPEFETLAYGYTAHESAHFKYSDYEVLVESLESPLRKSLTNILEDIRIEKAIGIVYPGLRTFLDNLNKLMIKKGLFGTTSAFDSPVSIVTSYVLYSGYYESVKLEEFFPLFQSAQDALLAHFSHTQCADLQTIINKIHSAQSNRDALDVADEIIAYLQVLIQQITTANENPPSDTIDGDEGDDNGDVDQPQAESDPNGDESNEGEEGDAQSEPNGDDNGCDNGNKESDPSGEETGQPKSQEPAKGKPSNDDSSADPGPSSEFVEAILNAAESDTREDTGELVSEMMHESAFRAKANMVIPLSIECETNTPSGGVYLEHVAKDSSGLRFTLSGVLQSEKHTKRSFRRQGARLATQRIPMISLGEQNLFVKRNVRTKAVNTAVSILLDASSSMRDGLMFPAQMSALSLSVALDGIKDVSNEVSFFPCGIGEDRSLKVIKSFAENARTVSGRFAIQPSGNTPTANALWSAVYRLVQRKEERKIVFVLTDGESNDADALRDVLQRCESSGIECVGIGIKTSAARDFPVNIRIDNVSDLNAALADLVKKKLLAA